MADPREINYHNGEKIYNKEKVDELLTTKQDVIIPDTTVQANDHLVENQAVKAYVDAETQRAEATEGDLADLVTTDKSNLVAAINEVKESAYTTDEHVTAGSTNPVQSAGIKEYVDTQDEATLDEAKDYTDSKIGELQPGDGSTVVELTGHLDDLDNAAESLVTAINAEGNRITTVENTVSGLNNDLEAERQARIQGDQTLDTKITQVEQAKQDKLTFDDEPTHGSNNPVKSTGIKDYVDEITGQLDDLETPAESLVTAINQLDSRFPETEEAPTKDSDKIAKSGGTWNAIRFASVKVGETMIWPQFKTESRVVKSGNTPEGSGQFKFDIAGKSYDVTVPEETLELKIADNVPDGWHAFDGKAELLATDYPELTEFFGGCNITKDGKIWLPYIPCKIIKVRY